MTDIPPPTEADLALTLNDFVRFYRYLSGRLDEYGLSENMPSTRAFIRRCHAAERERDALRAELATIKAETVEHILDGQDFNWVEAIIAVRYWREQTAELAAENAKLTAERDGLSAEVRKWWKAYKEAIGERVDARGKQ